MPIPRVPETVTKMSLRETEVRLSRKIILRSRSKDIFDDKYILKMLMASVAL